MATLNPIGAETQREKRHTGCDQSCHSFCVLFSFSSLSFCFFYFPMTTSWGNLSKCVCVCVCMVLVFKERNKTPKPNRARGRMDKDGRDTKRWKPGLQGGKRFHMYFGCEPGAKSVDCLFFLACLPFFNTFHAQRGEQTELAFFPFFAARRTTLGALLETQVCTRYGARRENY